MNLAGEDTGNDLLFVGFNQDSGCFACGTEKGFIIYNTDPLKERFRREFETGGIGIVEMLFRCNILALVGGGRNPKYPPNKVMIWDDYQNKCIAELEFRSEVKSVKLRRDRIVVVLRNKAYVYNFADLQLLHQIETADNSKGIVALSPSSDNTVLAVPHTRVGYVLVELFDKKETKQILAHSNTITQLALNLDGTLLATASEKGTLIRVFDTSTGERIREVRRGTDRADIHSIAFHPESKYLSVSSDKGTVHIYSLLTEQTDSQSADEPGKNKVSAFSFFKGFVPYVGSEWSFAQCHLPESRSICCFGSHSNTLIAVCSDGKYHKFSFDQSGEVKTEEYAVYLKPGH